MVSAILAANTISNIGKLAKTVHPDSFGEEPSSLILRKLMIAGSSLWWRYVIRMANHPLHPFPYPQSIISTPIVYWQALSMHCLQNTISQKRFPYNKESTPLFLPHVGFKHGPLQLEFDTKRPSSTFQTELPSVFIDFLTPFFLDSSHSNNPKAPYKTKNRKTLNQHPIYRAKTSD